MGILSSLKKLFFATESVAKSTVNHTVETIKEKASDVIEKSNSTISSHAEKLENKTSGLKDAIIESASKGFGKALDVAEDLVDKTKDIANDVTHKIEVGLEKIAQNETVQKAADFTEKVGDKVLDTGEQFMDKAKSFTENVGAKVMEEGGEIMEKAKSVSETVGAKVMEVKDEMVSKAKEAMKDFEQKFEDLKDKAVKAEAEEAAKPKKEFADETLDASKPLLDDKDDFFSKAEKFAKGQYDAFKEEVTNAQKTTDEVKKDLPPLELPKDDTAH
jgi:capsid protein